MQIRSLLSILLLSFLISTSVFSQGSTNRAFASKAEEIAVSANARGINLMNRMKGDGFNTKSWVKDIYREVDFNSTNNRILFYPKVSNDSLVNLFSLIFNLVKEDMVPLHPVIIGANSNASNTDLLKDVLDNYEIANTVVNGKVQLTDPKDLNEKIVTYYVREQWYYDTKTGEGGVNVIAICPVLKLKTENGSIENKPLFWLLMSDIAPYLDRASGDLSTYKSFAGANVSWISFFDYFIRQRYEGEIYQVGTELLSDTYKTPEAIKRFRVELETELDNMKNISRNR